MNATKLEDLNLTPLAEAKTEPPFTRSLTGLQLMSLKEVPLVLDLPACSVAVERCVKEVTEASTLCVDSVERDGLIFQKMSARMKNPYKSKNRVYGEN